MSTSKEYLAFVLEQLADLEGIRHRAMMGEYVIYYRDKVVGGIYDDRFLIKATKSVRSLMPEGPYEIPYQGAKEMLLVDLEDRAVTERLLTVVYEDLLVSTSGRKR